MITKESEQDEIDTGEFRRLLNCESTAEEDEATVVEEEATSAVVVAATTMMMALPVEGEVVECPAIPRWDDRWMAGVAVEVEVEVEVLPEDPMPNWPVWCLAMLISGGISPIRVGECRLTVEECRLTVGESIGEGALMEVIIVAVIIVVATIVEQVAKVEESGAMP